jgi:N-acetylmuramoyl-L-alanine amidase
LGKIIPTLKASPSKIAPKNYGRKINGIVIHCTASSQNASAQDILNYFKNVKKWNSPGYHYIIEPNGTIVNTWSLGKVSNGVKGYNRDTVHISYIGGKDNDDRTFAQKQSMVNLVNQLRQPHELGKIPVKGHRDYSPDLNNNGIIESFEWIKRCPSFEVSDWLKENNIV